jgi:hypothetical protein
MNRDRLYIERVTSDRTEALFIVLAILSVSLFAWRLRGAAWDSWNTLFFSLFALFVFYALNFRTLIIQLGQGALKLTFGIFSWTVPFENIDDCRFDEIPAVMWWGGAGIHFMFIRKRYRASFNFLEHPRVVVAFKKSVGPVRDISFSTRRPDDVLQFLRRAVSESKAA